MFDFGVTELLVIAVIGLLVIGPERLPKVAKTLGHLFGKMKRYVSEIKHDIEKEANLQELKEIQRSVEKAGTDIEDEMNNQVKMINTEFEGAKKEIDKSINQIESIDEKKIMPPSLTSVFNSKNTGSKKNDNDNSDGAGKSNQEIDDKKIS